MMKTSLPLWAALIAVGLLAVLCTACGGGSSAVTNPGDGTISAGNNDIPTIPIEGPTQYPGQQPAEQPTLPSTDPLTPGEAPWDWRNIFTVPIDSNGTGRVVVNNFTPGEKVALVVLNLNPAYLDIQYQPNQGYTPLPDARYSFQAELVQRSTSSMASAEDIRVATEDLLGSPSDYQGMPSSAEMVDPAVLYEREALADGNVPYAAEPPVKTASLIQKGETRTFWNVDPTFLPPTILPGPGDPTRDTSEFEYPYEYRRSQDGRLVSIGAHCLVFLSMEINNGNPDSVQFTEARLNRLAKEFDTNIYPKLIETFGPVRHYNEGNIGKNLDRSIVLTGDDFSQNGQLLVDLPGTVDTDISAEQKIIIFLFDSVGGNGGFYAWGLSSEARQKLIDEGREADLERLQKVGTTLYIDANNFPPNDSGWNAAYSIIAHEFQHKLYADNEMPTRDLGPSANFGWFNESLSMMAIHVAGYTVNSGKIIDWAIDGQLTDYLANTNTIPEPMDGRPGVSTNPQYGVGFLFMLYLHEHYPAGLAKRIYAKAKTGETDYIKLIESATGEKFDQTYAKWVLANFIDGIYAANDEDLFDPRFHYNTIDLRGTVNLASGTIVLPGVRTTVFPREGGYPVSGTHRSVMPWCSDYLVLSNGDGRDLQFTLYSDQYFRMFVLPVNFNSSLNAVELVDNITIP